jgi:hypothetical protein
MATDFFNVYVRPAYEEWKTDKDNLRLANNLASELNNIVEHYWHVNNKNSSANVSYKKVVNKFRNDLADKIPGIGTIRDIADSQKHLYICRDTAKAKNAEDVEVKNIGWRQGYGLRWGGGPIIAVKLDDGSVEYFDVFAEKVYQHWESILT